MGYWVVGKRKGSQVSSYLQKRPRVEAMQGTPGSGQNGTIGDRLGTVWRDKTKKQKRKGYTGVATTGRKYRPEGEFPTKDGDFGKEVVGQGTERVDELAFCLLSTKRPWPSKNRGATVLLWGRRG